MIYIVRACEEWNGRHECVVLLSGDFSSFYAYNNFSFSLLELFFLIIIFLKIFIFVPLQHKAHQKGWEWETMYGGEKKLAHKTLFRYHLCKYGSCTWKEKCERGRKTTKLNYLRLVPCFVGKQKFNGIFVLVFFCISEITWNAMKLPFMLRIITRKRR